MKESDRDEHLPTRTPPCLQNRRPSWAQMPGKRNVCPVLRKQVSIFLCMILFQGSAFFSVAQTDSIHFFRKKIAAAGPADLVELELKLGKLLVPTNRDSAILHFERVIVYYEKLPESKKKELLFLKGQSLNEIGSCLYHLGNFDLAIKNEMESIRCFNSAGDTKGAAAAYINLGTSFLQKGDFSSAIQSWNKSLSNFNNLDYKPGKAISLDNIGVAYSYLGQNDTALFYHRSGLKLFSELGDKKGISECLLNIAYICEMKGDIKQALDLNHQCLKLREELNDKEGLANVINNLGMIYYKMGDVRASIDHNKRALQLLIETGNMTNLGSSYNNVGYLYFLHGDPDAPGGQEEKVRQGLLKALEHYRKSEDIQMSIGNQVALANVWNNFGYLYRTKGDPECLLGEQECRKSTLKKALHYFQKSLEIQRITGDKAGICSSLLNLSNIYCAQKDMTRSLKYARESMQLCREIGYVEKISHAAEQLYFVYKAINNYELAMENFEVFIQMRDSLSNDMNKKASIKQQLKHEYETKAAADSVAHAKESEVKNAELKKQEAEIKAKKNQQYALFGGLALVMIFAGFMFNRFKVTQKQKGIIELQKTEVEKQKLLVEHKQKEILDSIHYSRRIQLAQIPSEKRVEMTLERLRK